MPEPSQERAEALIVALQKASEGYLDAEVYGAAMYVVANAIANFARDRAEASKFIERTPAQLERYVDGVWEQCRAARKKSGAESSN